MKNNIQLINYRQQIDISNIWQSISFQTKIVLQIIIHCFLSRLQFYLFYFIDLFLFQFLLQQMSIQFHEMLTSTFEYPSEGSFSDEQSNGSHGLDDFNGTSDSDLLHNGSFLGNSTSIGKKYEQKKNKMLEKNISD